MKSPGDTLNRLTTSRTLRSICSGELSRSRFRSGPLYQLQTSIDDSRLLADGRLIRSNRIARLEAALLISRGATSARKLVQLAGLVDAKEVQQLVELLNTSYDNSDSSFRIERTATGFMMMTRPDLVTWLDRLHERQSQMRLSQPMMETLTIVAYQQPVTRVGVEAIRGVQSSEMIRQLMDRGLVKVGGEEDSLGRPFLYITTPAFLDMFGLGKIEDLPDFETLGRQKEVEIAADASKIEAEEGEAVSEHEVDSKAAAASENNAA